MRVNTRNTIPIALEVSFNETVDEILDDCLRIANGLALFLQRGVLTISLGVQLVNFRFRQYVDYLPAHVELKFS